MPSITCLLPFILALLALLGTNLLAQDNIDEQNVDPKSKTPPVVRLGSWHGHQVEGVLRLSYREWSASNPLTIESAEQVAKYFKEDSVLKLRKQVDFDKQTLAVWSWEGSGQDELECYVCLSDPTKVLFRIQPGASKDLRQHLYVFAIRKDVTRAPGSLGLIH